MNLEWDSYDKIHIKDLIVFANHGVFPEENTLGQKFTVSATMYTHTRPAGLCDKLAKSIDYGGICKKITEYLQVHTYRLLESAAEGLAEELLLSTPHLEAIRLEIKKPWAPVGLPLDTVSVEITRGYHQAYIAIGSNMGDKKAYLDMAVKALDELQGCQVQKVSEYLVTEPYGGVEQDDFLNGVLKLRTYLEPMELLEKLHEIEQKAGRERLVHWGPRTLDLDILLYDHAVIDTETLTIPHAGMHLRDFVLKPLAEIAPYERHPILHKRVIDMLEELENK
ncbi:MAG: 2-amino-4-hydroxy-6-hydroxymethyldihydropteridine diphosphokinase [Blautia sp.]|jgi:dihydroneopterin aldolase/2-amino-4-hydroxy-6-hydroxymethyldihydropteridine diphosphokinase